MATRDGDGPGATPPATRKPKAPRELRFVGLSDDGAALSLADSRGAPYEVRLEGRLATALRLDHRAGQMEIALTPLTPREIQSRIRQGSSVDELVEETGWERSRIDRFAGPPLAERAFMADRARDVAIVTNDGGAALGALVDQAAVEAGVGLDELRWDAWQREDGVWTVIAAFPAGTADRVHTWTYDHRAHVVDPVDDAARSLLGASAPTLTVVGDAKPATSKRTSKRTTQKSTQQADTKSAQQSDTNAEPTADTAESDAAESGPESGPGSAPEPPAKSTRRGRRASVPTWDEILFGAGDDDAG